MRVRCVRIVEGGRRGGVEVAEAASIHIGGEYVVLEMLVSPVDGVSYLLLRDSSFGGSMWTSEMFEITDGTFDPSWEADDPYEGGVVITIGPRAWQNPAYRIGRVTGNRDAADIFRREAACMYEAEGLALPDQLVES